MMTDGHCRHLVVAWGVAAVAGWTSPNSTLPRPSMNTEEELKYVRFDIVLKVSRMFEAANEHRRGIKVSSLQFDVVLKISRTFEVL